MATPTLAPIPRELYSDNQMLFVADFQREQTFHVQHRELLTRLLVTPGVLAGFAVSSPNPTQVWISNGVGVDASGRQIILAGAATLNHTPLESPPNSVMIDFSGTPAPGSGTNVIHYLLAVEAGEAKPSDTYATDCPNFLLLNAQPSPTQIPLANLTVTVTSSPQPSKPNEPKPPVVTVKVAVDTTICQMATFSPQRVAIPNLDAGKITMGTLSVSVIPNLDASKITTGTLNSAVVPPPDVSKAKGTLPASAIPNLDASKITTGTLKPEVVPPPDASKLTGHIPASAIPDLDAAKIVSGTLKTAVIPHLDASKIATGTLNPAVVPPPDVSKLTGTLPASAIPGLDASKIISGVISLDRLPDLSQGAGGLETVWAADVALAAAGAGLSAEPVAASKSGFLVGLLRARSTQGATWYALAIGFPKRLMSFRSPTLEASGLKLSIFAERTAFALPSGEALQEARFVGVDPASSFNLLDPAAKGDIRSLVVVGVTASNSAAPVPVGAAAIVNQIRNAASPFGFVAQLADIPVPAPADAAARALSAAGAIAPDAAAILAAQAPGQFSGAAGATSMSNLLAANFASSTGSPIQMAWSLASAGFGAQDTAPAIVARYKLQPMDMLAATAGAYPPPGTQTLIVQLQDAGTAAGDAAGQIRPTSPFYNAQPAALGVTLRLNFPDTCGTPKLMAQALKNAQYPADAVRAALDLLFPGAKGRDLTTAVSQSFK